MQPVFQLQASQPKKLFSDPRSTPVAPIFLWLFFIPYLRHLTIAKIWTQGTSSSTFLSPRLNQFTKQLANVRLSIERGSRQNSTQKNTFTFSKYCTSHYISSSNRNFYFEQFSAIFYASELYTTMHFGDTFFASINNKRDWQNINWKKPPRQNHYSTKNRLKQHKSRYHSISLLVVLLIRIWQHGEGCVRS